MAKTSTRQAPNGTNSNEEKRYQIFLTDDDKQKADMMAGKDRRSFPKFMAWLLDEEWARREAKKKAA